MHDREPSPPAPQAPELAPDEPTAAWKWGVCTLLFLATMLNYMDRLTMNSVADGVSKEFQLDEPGYGDLELAFTAVYAFAQLPMGFLADRLDLRWFYASSVLIWSLAGLGTGLVHTFGALLAFRALLGLAEASNWPCALVATQRLLPPRDRSLGNGFFNSGGSVGAILTPLTVLLVTGGDQARWRPPFVVVGLLGAAWVLGWLLIVQGPRARALRPPPAPPPSAARAGPQEPSRGPGAREPLRRILLTRRFAIVFVLSIAVNVCWHFFRIWIKLYLVKDRHLGNAESLRITSAFYLAAALGSLWAGRATGWLVRNGVSVDHARKAILLVCAACALLAPGAALVQSPRLATTLLLVVGFGSWGCFANYFAYAQDVSPTRVGAVMGILGFVGHFSVAVGATRLAGLVVRWTHSWKPNLTIAGLLPLLGWAVLVLYWKPENANAAENAA